MIEGSCHCGAVHFRLNAEPQWLTRCNCSICRRLGAVWAHDDLDKIELRFEKDAVIRYSWGDKSIVFVTCKTCGSSTHWESADPAESPRMAVNCAMADPKAVAGIRIRNFDGADTWRYLD